MMFVWDIVSRISGEIIGLAELIAKLIFDGLFYLFKMWFDYLVQLVSGGNEISFVAFVFLVFTTVGFGIVAYYIVKYVGIWGLILAPVLLLFLKFFILIILGLVCYTGISLLVSKVKNRGGTYHV